MVLAIPASMDTSIPRFAVPGTVPSTQAQRVQLFGNSARRVTRGQGSRNCGCFGVQEYVITDRVML